MIAAEPVVLHLPGSLLRDQAKLAAFYGRIGDGLAARGARVDYLLHDRDKVPDQIEADQGFHIIDHGRIRHPRVLNAGLGFIRPYHYLDPWGIRAFSSIAAKTFDPAALDAAAVAEFRGKLYRRLVGQRRSRHEQPVQVLPVPPRAIAVFLQTEVHRDVGETCYITMRRMVKALIARDDPRPIVIKTHPNDTDLVTLEWLVQKTRKDSRVRIIPGNIHDILSACDVVVTINSAVGIEAMLHRKPVVLCGQADFHHCAVTLRDRHRMDAAIAEAESRVWPHDAYLYWFFHLHGLSAQAPDLIDQVIARIGAHGYDPQRLGIAPTL